MIEEAINKLDMGIQAQVAVLASGRGLAGNSQSFNELVKAKETLEKMQKNPKKKKDIEADLTCEYCGATGLTKLTLSRWHKDGKCLQEKK